MNAFANPYQLRPQFFQLFPSPLELHTPRHIQTQANAVPPFFVIHCHRTYDQPPPVLPSPLPSPLRNSQPCPILQPRWGYPPRLRNLPRRNATPPFICMFPPHNATWGVTLRAEMSSGWYLPHLPHLAHLARPSRIAPRMIPQLAFRLALRLHLKLSLQPFIVLGG